MRTIVHNAKLVILEAECDADRALLGLWSQQTPRVASSKYSLDVSAVTEVCIEFNPILLPRDRPVIDFNQTVERESTWEPNMDAE